MNEKSNWKKNCLVFAGVILADAAICALYSLLAKQYGFLWKHLYILTPILMLLNIFIYWFFMEYPDIRHLEKEERNSKIFYQINWFARRHLGLFMALLLIGWAIIMFWFN